MTHALVQPLEQHPQPVALALDAAEGAAQLAAHPFEVVRERAELVAEAVVERRLEVAERERLRRDREAAQPECDQLREHESDEHADQAGDHAGAQRLVVDEADRRRDVGARAEHDERAEPGAAQRHAGDEDAPVRRAGVVAPARERILQRGAFLLRRAHGLALRRCGCDAHAVPVVEVELEVELPRDASEAGCRVAVLRRGGDARRGLGGAGRPSAAAAWLRKAFSERVENCDTTIAVEVAATTANAAPSHHRTPMKRRVMAES